MQRGLTSQPWRVPVHLKEQGVQRVWLLGFIRHHCGETRAKAALGWSAKAQILETRFQRMVNDAHSPTTIAFNSSRHSAAECIAASLKLEKATDAPSDV